MASLLSCVSAPSPALSFASTTKIESRLTNNGRGYSGLAMTTIDSAMPSAAISAAFQSDLGWNNANGTTIPAAVIKTRRESEKNIQTPRNTVRAMSAHFCHVARLRSTRN